jgi:hypothetical protein
MRLGFILPVYIYSDERLKWAERGLDSLRRTAKGSYYPPLLCVTKPGKFDDATLALLTKQPFPAFIHYIANQPADASELNSAFAWGYEHIFERFPWVTHACILCEDWIFNPQWMMQLECLISRHPDAVGWSVYRSNNARWHRTLRQEGEDCLVTSVNGPGAISREGWAAWGKSYRDFPSPTGYSIDLLHVIECPGERWTTYKSYIQHIGLRGTYAHEGELDLSLEFVGE